MTPEAASRALALGTRVRVKLIKVRGGGTFGGFDATIVTLPGTSPAVPAGLYGVVADDGQGYGIAPEGLESTN